MLFRSDIENSLLKLNNRFSNLEFHNINLKDLYYCTDKLFLALYNTIDNINKKYDKYIFNKLKTLVEIIKTNCNEVSITFNNIDNQIENKEEGCILLLDFWSNIKLPGLLDRSIYLYRFSTTYM